MRYKETETNLASEAAYTEFFFIKNKGYVDHTDGITLTDAISAFRYIAGKENLDLTGSLAADVNSDGKVSVIDAMKIFRYVSGKSDSL